MSNYQPIEKKFKRPCSKCGKMDIVIKGHFGHKILCDSCSRIKILNQVNSIVIPSFLIKKHGFKDKKLYMADHPKGILIRKATKKEMI
jgi:hypothetical protein